MDERNRLRIEEIRSNAQIEIRIKSEQYDDRDEAQNDQKERKTTQIFHNGAAMDMKQN